MYIDNKPEEEQLSPLKLEKCLVTSLLNCIYSEKLRDTKGENSGYYSKLAFF
jgi:hypothetical protein